MRALGHLIVRLVAILFGLALAFVGAGLFLGYGLYSESAAGSETAVPPHGPAGDGLAVLIAAIVSSPFIAAAALGPSLLMIALAEGFRLRGLIANLVLGACAALLSAWLGRQSAPLEMSTGALVVLLATGFVGGFLYWLVAGRSAGRWLDRP